MSPLYDYRCGLGHTYTVRRSLEDSPEEEPCPDCKGFTLNPATARRQFPLTNAVVVGGTPKHHTRWAKK